MLRWLLLVSLALALTWVSLSASYARPPFQVRSYSLDNGLRILIQEKHDIPNVALDLFYRVGSRDDPAGLSGISHFFEHMMFNGSRRFGPRQFDREMESHGGNDNAYTTRDLTYYTDWFPREALDLVLRMEADRMRNLTLDPGMVRSEREVVRSERLSTVENSNSGALLEALSAGAYLAHPYRNPIVGWEFDMAAWSLRDLERQYRAAYAPNNCTLVIAGDVAADEALRLVKLYFGPIPPHAPPRAVHTREPEQTGERRVVIRRPAEAPLQYVAWHVPPTGSPDYRALETLSAILASGRGSILQRRLIEQDRLALSVRSWQEPGFDPTHLTLTIRGRPGVDIPTLERAWQEEISRVMRDGVTETELSRTTNQSLLAHYRALRTASGTAELLGWYEIYFGSAARVDDFERETAAVTLADVRRVARKYLDGRNRTVATLIPEPH